MRILALLVVIACAPTVDGPLEQQRARDTADSQALVTQLASLPGAVRVDATIRRPVHDPLGASQPESAAVLVIVDDKADRAAIERSVRLLLHGAFPEITDPQVAIEVGATRPELAKVGPFTVERHSKGPLVALLAVALGLVAALAGWIAWRERPPGR